MIATQHTLVARLKEQPLEADWERFYRLYEQPILAVAAARSLNEADCQDVLNETMIKMFRHGFRRYDQNRGRFTIFLFGIAKDCALDALRRRARRSRHEQSLNGEGKTGVLGGGPIDPALTPAAEAELEGQRALIGTALDYLLERRAFAPKTVEIFRAVVLAQESPREVAIRFRTSRGNVDQAKSTVLKKLRRMYGLLDAGFDLDEAFSQLSTYE